MDLTYQIRDYNVAEHGVEIVFLLGGTRLNPIKKGRIYLYVVISDFYERSMSIA